MSALEEAHRLLAREARRDFHAFVEYVGADEDGNPLEQRALDRLVWSFVDDCHARGIPAGVMLPMGFGKTTQFCYRTAYEIGRNENLLATVVTDSVDNSKERVELVRRIIDQPRYRRVFPKIRVVEGKDERQRFTVERKGLSKDPTCSAEGVLTGTGTRTNFLLLDDVVTLRNAILEPLNRPRVVEAIRTTWMSRTRIHGKTPVRIAWLQTAYHMADASAVLREDPECGWRWLVVRAEPPYDALAYEVWERGTIARTGSIAPPFPAEKLRERAALMGPTAAARGLGNRPVSGEECVFREEHFLGPPPLDFESYSHRILFADPAGDATRAKTGETDYCAIVVIGRHPERCWDVLAADRMRGAPSEQASFIARKARQYKVHAVYQEAVKDEALVSLTQQKIRDLGWLVGVQPEKPTTNKELRITQILEPALAASPPILRVCGRLFPELKAEALCFPVGAHDDLIDALAGAFSKAGRGMLSLLSGPRTERDEHPEDSMTEFERVWAGYAVRESKNLSGW